MFTGKGFDRRDKWLKRTYSKIFYAIFGYLTNTRQDPSIGNFGIYQKKVIDSILAMKDYHRYFPTMVRWVGFKHHQNRCFPCGTGRRAIRLFLKKA